MNRLVVAGAALALIVGSSYGAQAQQTVKLVDIAELSGAGTTSGTNWKNGVDLAVKDVVELVPANSTLCARTRQNTVTCWGEAAFAAGVEEIAGVSGRLLRLLETSSPAKNREEEAAKAKARSAERYGKSGTATVAGGRGN